MKNVSFRTYDDFIEGFKDEDVAIAEDLKQCGFFKSRSNLTSSEQKFLKNLLNRDLTHLQWTKALQKLTKFMHELTNREVVVLVDEYDTPMSEAL